MKRSRTLSIASLIVLIQFGGHVTVRSFGVDLLVLEGETVQLYGSHSFGEVHILNGGVLQVQPYDGSGDTGLLEINADSIRIDEGGIISADGSGYRGRLGEDGEGPGGGQTAGPGLGVYCGGSGGGYGEYGDPGVGPTTSVPGGSIVHRRDPWNILPGSGGGGYVSFDFSDIVPANYHVGGNGGGAVILRARSLILDGRISADGQSAPMRNPFGYESAAGGGSGGGVLIVAGSVSGRGTFSVRGGEPGTDFNRSGGRGGGGRVVILYSQSLGLGPNQFGGTAVVFTDVYRDPSIASSTHPNQSEWYADDSPHFTWEEQSDFPILGYRYALVEHSVDVGRDLMRTADFAAGNWVSFSNVPDGTHRLYVVYVLPNSLVTLPLVSYYVNIDTHALPPVGLRSPTHPDPHSAYMERDGFVEWNDPHELSGVAEYLVAVTQNLAAPESPDEFSTVSVPRYVFQNLADGTHYVHVRTRDVLGNESELAVFAVTIGSQPPPTPTPAPVPVADLVVTSTTHPDPNQWYADRFVQLSWDHEPHDGILGYQYLLTINPGLASGNSLLSSGRFTTRPSAVFSEISTGTHYFYVVIVYEDSTFSDLQPPYRIQIDTQASPPINLRSPTHPDSALIYLERDGYVRWDEPSDRAGVDGYLLAFTEDSEPPENPDEYAFLRERLFVFTDLSAGVYNVHVRTRDVLGNISDAETLQISIAITRVFPTPIPQPTATPTVVPPRAHAGADTQLPHLGATALLNGSGSTGSGWPIEEYSWREDPDNPIRSLLPSFVEEPTIDVTPPVPGLYRFTLVVRTALQNSAPDSVLVRVPGIAGSIKVVGTDVPVSGVVVTDASSTAVTDSLGKFILYGSTQGITQLDATHAMFDPFSQTLVVPSTGLNFEFSLTGQRYAFSGQVVDTGGFPLDQVTVMVEPYSNLKTSTDIDGNFFFGDVPFGSRLVSFSKAGYGSTSMPLYFGRDVTDLVVRLQPGFAASLYGRVTSMLTGLPMPGVEVSWGEDYATISDDEGSYSLTGLYTGSNILRAKGVGVYPYYRSLEVSENGLIHDIEVDEPPISVGGVIENNGYPVSGATVWLEGSREPEVITDGTGYFFLPRISTGRRELVITVPDGESRIHTFDVERSLDVRIDYDALQASRDTSVDDWIVR